MSERKTKGKQKINIQKIEKDEARLVTFSKRRLGIYTKLTELSVLCGADVGFLVKSGSGKPYTYGNPSFETVAQRFLNGVHLESSTSSSSIIDAYKKKKMNEHCNMYNDLIEKAHAEEEKVVEVAKRALPVNNNAWWNIDSMNDEEEARRLLAKFEELYKNLCEVAASKIHGGNGVPTSQVNNNN